MSLLLSGPIGPFFMASDTIEGVAMTQGHFKSGLLAVMLALAAAPGAFAQPQSDQPLHSSDKIPPPPPPPPPSPPAPPPSPVNAMPRHHHHHHRHHHWFRHHRHHWRHRHGPAWSPRILNPAGHSPDKIPPAAQ